MCAHGDKGTCHTVQQCGQIVFGQQRRSIAQRNEVNHDLDSQTIFVSGINSLLLWCFHQNLLQKEDTEYHQTYTF